MCIEGCWGAGVGVEPVWAREIRKGALDGTGLIVVPGGWARLKLAALGRGGIKALRQFVSQGGWYLGLCGGAGLGLKGGLGLVGMERARGQGRLPLLSGPLRVRREGGEWFWRGLGEEEVFYVWWPGQFGELIEGVEVVASYSGAEPGLVSGEEDVVSCRDWEEAERRAGVRLNPRVLWGTPAVITAEVGKGRAVLSYLHLDTPRDLPGARALRNICYEALGSLPPAPPLPAHPSTGLGQDLVEEGRRLIEMGRKLGILRPRPGGLPVLARGKRGLELMSLGWMMQAAGRWAGAADEQELKRLWEDLRPVVEKAQGVWERLAAEPGAAETSWFPGPRRWGGALERALGSLEWLTGTLARRLIRAQGA